jgi:hypothetical protein
MNGSKRTELINKLSLNCVSKTAKGNTLWTLRKKGSELEIVCYDLFKGGDGWDYKEYLETSPPPLFSCPLKYLEQTTPLNAEWRDSVLDYEKSRKSIKQQIRFAFKNLKKGEKIQVILQARPGYKLNVYKITILSVYPGIEGRAEDHKRYRVPFKLVKEIKIIPESDYNNDD